MSRLLTYGIIQQKRKVDLDSFIIKVNHTAGFTLTLPLYNALGYNYNFVVSWGDGASGTVTSATDSDRIHTYATGKNGSDDWVITITGTLEGWTGNTVGLKEYITEVTQWGVIGAKHISMSNCAKLINCYGKLNTTYLTDISSLFNGCTAMVSCDVSEWDVSTITIFGSNYAGVFYNCTSLTSLDTSNWVFNATSNIVFTGVFTCCAKLTTIGDTSGWNTGKFINCTYCFYQCSLLASLEVGGWDMSNCTSFSVMFDSCTSLTSLDVSGWNVAKCTLFGGMFSGCTNITSLSLDNWVFSTTSNIDFSSVFSGCTKLTTIGTVTSLVTTKFTNLAYTFFNCAAITSLNLSSWDTSNVTIMYLTFGSCIKMTSCDVSGWNVAKCTNFGTGYSGMFYNCVKLTSLDLTDWTFSTVSNISTGGMFCGDVLLTTIGDTSGWNTEKWTDTSYMFWNCNVLASLDVSGWDVSNITTWYVGASDGSMFLNCRSLTTLDVSGWVFSSTTDLNMTSLFSGCYGLTTLDVSGWNTTKFKYLNGTFYNCYGLTTIDVSSWDTSNVISMSTTFKKCSGLTTLNVSAWNVTKCTNFGSGWEDGTFTECSALTSLDVSGWVLSSTSNITMVDTFSYCTNLVSITGIGSLNMAKVTTTAAMFRHNFAMTTCDTSAWDTSGISNCSFMFWNDSALITSMPDTKWWNRSPGIGTYTNCFAGCTAISNYASIPNNWKGL